MRRSLRPAVARQWAATGGRGQEDSHAWTSGWDRVQKEYPCTLSS